MKNKTALEFKLSIKDTDLFNDFLSGIRDILEDQEVKQSTKNKIKKLVNDLTDREV